MTKRAPRPAPVTRVRSLNDADVRPGGRYVLYWMIASRRLVHSFALEHAVARAAESGLPLVVFEPLRVGYRHASPRFHAFVLQGMRENHEALTAAGITSFPYVEPEPGAGQGLLAALAADAALVVTDDHPGFHYPAMLAAAARQVGVRLEAVDGNGLAPLRDTDKTFSRAVDLRRHLQRTLPDHLQVVPLADPLGSKVPLTGARIDSEIRRRWPAPSDALLAADPDALDALPLDPQVGMVEAIGGPASGSERLDTFLRRRLPRYVEDRRSIDESATSGLSPWLHFGHVGAHQVFDAIVRQEGWSRDELGDTAKGQREGWWGMSPEAEAFLDQLVTWRELGFRAALTTPAPDTYAAIPAWARASLEQHLGDERPALYERDALEAAATDDDLWNAAQCELLRDGVIHNQLRMLWGKKVLSWTPDAESAFEVLVHLNDRWALDGRDPNSYSGIGWVLGRFDRPWAPERPIYGRIRYMTSASALRKLDLDDYLDRYRP